MSWSGAVLKVCMMSQPCFRAVSTTVRSMQKFSTPSSVRKHPETFCRTFVILRSRSASLFVNGTVRSLRKSKTPVFRALNRNARLCPMRRFRRPCFFRIRRGRERWLVLVERNSLFATGIKSALDFLDCFRVDCVPTLTSRGHSLASARRAEWSSCQTPTALSQTRSAPQLSQGMRITHSMFNAFQCPVGGKAVMHCLSQQIFWNITT